MLPQAKSEHKVAIDYIIAFKKKNKTLKYIRHGCSIGQAF